MQEKLKKGEDNLLHSNRKEGRNNNPDKKYSLNKDIIQIDKNIEDIILPHSERKEENNKNSNRKDVEYKNKQVTFKQDIKYNTRSVTSSIKKREKEKVKRKSPHLAKIQRRTILTFTTSEEYEDNKKIRHYIRNQTKIRNDAEAEIQPITDIKVRRLQKQNTEKEINLDELLKEDMK